MATQTLLHLISRPTTLRATFGGLAVKMDDRRIGDECHVVRLLITYGDSILAGTFLSRIQEDIGIHADQDVEQLQAQCMHPRGSVSQNDAPRSCTSWPCPFCIRVISLAARSPSMPRMIDQIKSYIQPPNSSAGDDFKEVLRNDLEDPEQIPFKVAPLRIKDHPRSNILQSSARQNINQSLTSLSLDEAAQMLESEVKTSETMVESKELSGAGVLQIETTNENAVGGYLTKHEVLGKHVPKTPSALRQRTSDTSLPEIHSGSEDEEDKTPPTWTTSPELSRQLDAQDGRDSFRRRAFGSPYSKFQVPMKEMFPGTKTKCWARTGSEGKFSNIYSPSPNSHARPHQTTTKSGDSSALASTPSRVGSDNIVRTVKWANTSLAAPAKRGLRPRACKATSSSETGNPKLTGAGLDAVGELSPIPRNCEMAPQLKVGALNLAGTGFDAPAKRPVKSRNSQSTQPHHPKTPPTNSVSSKDQAEISSSVENLYPIIHALLSFLPTGKVMQYSNFNPYSINSTSAAVLTEKKMETLEKQGAGISAQIRSSIDDSQLEEIFAPDNFTLNDLISQPGRRISNIRDAISTKQKHKKDILNVLDWVDYSVARVYESMSSVEEVRKSREDYRPDVMNVYLCIWAWFRLLGPILDGQRQRSCIVLLLRRGVGITRLKSYLNANHRPISFHILLTQLRTLKPTVGDGNFTSGCRTALEYFFRLLRGRRGPNGKTITDSIIMNALMWIPPAYHTTGDPSGGLPPPVTAGPSNQHESVLAASQNPRLFLLGASTSQNVIPDEGVVLGSDFDEESPPKGRRIQGEDDSGFGGITEGSSSDSMMEDSDHQISLANEVEKLATQLENCRSLITTDATATRPFKFSCGPESIRQLIADSPLGPPVFDIIVALAKPASTEYPTVYLGTFIYPEIEKVRFGHSKTWVNHIPRVGVWILPILINGHWRAMMMHWGEKEKTGKRGEMDKKGKELELYDPQHHQAGSDAAVRGKRIATRIKEWIAYLCDNNECITWKFKWALGPVQDRDDNVHCGIYTLQTVCSWYGGRHPVVQLADPIKLRRAFIRQLQEVVDGKKIRMVRMALGALMAERPLTSLGEILSS